MKRSRGKGKKPLEDEGADAEVPQVLNADADQETEEEEAGEEGDDIEFEVEDPPPIYLRSRVPEAYGVLKDILAERRGNWFSGYARNFRRNNRNGWRWAINAAVGVVAGSLVAVLTGDIVTAAAAAAAGMGAPTAASTVLVRNSRLDAQRRDYPDLPEFRDDWAVACYEFMRMVNGFNLRVEAIARLRRLAEEVDDDRRSDLLAATADAMSGLLWAWREELVEIAELLATYQTDDITTVLTPPETIATIRIISPLKDGRYDWLSLDPEIIPPGHEQELYDRDIREIACHQEAADAIDPYEALRRERLKNGEPID